MSGYSEDELLTMHVPDFEAVEDPQLVAEHMQKVISLGSDRFESKHRRKDGTIFQVEVSIQYRSEEGGQCVCFFRDITEIKKTENALSDREKKYKFLFDQSNDGIFLHDLKGNIIDTNLKASKMLGYEHGKLNQLSLQMLHPDSEAENSMQAFEQTKNEGQFVFESKFIKKDGSIIDIDISSSIVDQKEGIVQGIVRDITERKKMEERIQEAQKMESIGNLAGGIAHDFNNILFPIVGMSELLLEDLPLNSPEHENAQEILKAGKRGSNLVQQILAFGRQSEHKKIPIRIQQILKEVFKLIRSTIPSNIEITQDIQSDCGFIMADPTQIHQVAMNLITNAYHALGSTGGTISVKLKESDLESDKLPIRSVIISISDTGAGIDPAIADKIFEPYFTTKKTGKGTGLGLAVVYGIIKELGGDIKAYSEPGKGSKFKVFLPLMNGSSETKAINNNVTIHPTGHERILLVDDEEPIVRLEKLMLEKLGYQVTSCISSIDALDALDAFRANSNSFDLVLTDMAMPNMTGDQLAKKIFSIRSDIPIIICTGFSEKINKKHAEKLGVKGFLMKPVLKSEIAQTVRKVLDESQIA